MPEPDRYCRRCQQHKPLACFSKSALRYPSGPCRVCALAYKHRYLAEGAQRDRQPRKRVDT